MQVSRRALIGGLGAGAAGAWLWSRGGDTAPPAPPVHYEITLPDAEWRKRLSPAAYDVLRHEGTERPFSSPLNDEHRAGIFSCAGCALPAFSSKTKFNSGTGWPSFWQPLPNAIGKTTDSSLGMERTEVHCRRCGGHLGHVFDDGPKPTGLRYCMNGVAMTFKPGAA
ncbi:peptide-methionine (R)-S-oxide reductase [Sphingomonas vulcanisoli]|uniref:peptide-methionine (R)-S-oxide reductase n=1 Tax=Sphingomonas vulcanisoli TaxID=1658060 RepID=A0ABX0TV01_9SPHN|nr:peptide-methionine (R)-S-oxide reductase MsrB [Sphingomonas vulcanisoli]NIJ08175.1 peptide-methionine (R)-S-oxide reductase [Sphingomonas vulcanisoli]